MTDFQSKLSEPKFHNWIKTGLALMLTKEGLTDTVTTEIEEFQKKTFKYISECYNIPLETTCKICSTEDIICIQANKSCKHQPGSPKHKPCPENSLCNYFSDAIKQAHRFSDPAWKNTDVKLWSKDPWQIAKCFMPREGYSIQHAASETDFNGVISVFLNYRGFQNKVSENLSMKSNNFSKARAISRDFRHSAIFEVNDDKFKQYIQILEKVLTDAKCISSSVAANEALQKIEKLSDSSWSITSAKEHIKSLFGEELRFEESETLDNSKEKETDRHSMIRKANEIVSSTKVNNEANLRIRLERSFSECRDNIRKEFADQLITVYQDQCSTLPISALLEEEDAQLLQFFTTPTMRQRDHHRIRKMCKTVESYKDIFIKGGTPCKNIYVTGDTGIGKTAVCQRMVLAWCHAKTGGKEDHNFSKDDIDVMNSFDFLFYVSLRETNLCHVTEMIHHQMQSAGKADLITQILQEENCLIILDGLDEWSHPHTHSSCPSNRKFPHRQASDKCTYLTTSRPWKLEGDRLKTNEIDQQIELKGLDKHACRKLSSSVIKHLNEKFMDSRDPDDFQNEIKRNKLQTVSSVPIIMMQLICLWFDEMTLSISRCALYSATLEMLFKRASDRGRTYFQETDLKTEAIDRKLPKCLNELQAVSKHALLLYKLGNLAFDSLFCEDGESGLVFESSKGKIYEITEIEMEFLLYVGILSKNKVVGTLSKRKLQLSFLHKSYQEFLAAMFIAMHEESLTDIANRIFATCRTLRIFLTYENVFVFLSGMCPDLMRIFSDNIKDLFSSDHQIGQYRRFSDYKYGFIVMLPPFSILTDEKLTHVQNAYWLLKSYQKFALQCQEECERSSHEKIEIPVEDMFISDSYSPELQSLLISNKDHIKSVATDQYFDDLLLVKHLEKISISEVGLLGEDIDKFRKCVNSSNTTLSCLSLSNSKGIFDFSALEFPNLQSIDLYDLVLKHNEIADLFAFISNKTDLIQILLFKIRCCDHNGECKGAKLDLTHHEKLNFLRLHSIFEYGHHETRLNTTSLGTLIFEGSLKAVDRSSSFFGDIRNAPFLFEVTLLSLKSSVTFNTLSSVLQTLKNLKRLSLYNCDFDEKYVALNSDVQREIEVVCMVNSTMTFSSFSAFVDRIPSDTKNGVSVHMLCCKIYINDGDTTPQAGADAAKNYVLSKKRFLVVTCTPFRIHFETVKRVNLATPSNEQ